MRIAVTGSSGFIGSHLVPVLAKAGHEVVEISRKNGRDICSWSSVSDIPACDVMVHLAAKTSVPDSFRNPREFHRVNFNATLHALELARLWNSGLVYMSSYLYGPPQYLPVDENHPLNPHNPYAQSKLLSEELCRGYQRDFDIPVTVFRLFNIYGPGQTGSFIIPEILQQIKSGRVSLKDPRPKRDYIHVSDVVSAVAAAVDRRLVGWNVFNLGTGKSWSVEELADFIKLASREEFEVAFSMEFRKGEVLDSVADTTRLQKSLEWSPAFPLQEGVKTLFK